MTLEELKLKTLIEGPYTPKTIEEFDDLSSWSDLCLNFVGCRWYFNDLWLYPFHWNNYIPEGYLITDIFLNTKPFIKNKAHKDSRFNILPFGFLKNN